MVTVTDKAVEVIRRFLYLVKNAKINIRRAIIFGSYASGMAGQWSDIDVAIVSDDFSGIPFYDRKMLNPFILKVDTSIEVHPFKPEDFTEDNEFVKEVIKTGIELKI